VTLEEKIEFLEDRIVQLKAEIETLKAKGNTMDTIRYVAPEKGLYTYGADGTISVSSDAALTFETLQRAVDGLRVGGLR
jgi:hypothetical protein